MKRRFLQALKSNGGTVSAALMVSRLPRRTAYRHFNPDPEFGESWREALEIAYDELHAVARERARNGVETVYTGKNGTRRVTRKKSDRLLIHLMDRAERRKWRGRFMDMGKITLGTLKEKGPKIGLSPQQINELQKALLEAYSDVPLI